MARIIWDTFFNNEYLGFRRLNTLSLLLDIYSEMYIIIIFLILISWLWKIIGMKCLMFG